MAQIQTLVGNAFSATGGLVALANGGVMNGEKLQQTLDTLDYKVWYYSTAEKAGTTAVPRNMPEEQVPENLRAARRRLKLTHAHESEMN